MKLTQLDTLLSLDRIGNIIRYSEMVKGLQGDIAEAGVWKGGTLELLAKLNPATTVWGFDSFEGLPPATENDNYHKEGDFNDVEYDNILGYLGTVCRNVNLVKGFFPTSFNEIDPFKKYKMVHIDTDLYQSVKDCLDYFYPRMVEGGVIISDDIGWDSVKGGEQALMEFVETINPTFKGELFYYPGHSNKQYLIIR
jgi:O-methyltransferase